MHSAILVFFVKTLVVCGNLTTLLSNMGIRRVAALNLLCEFRRPCSLLGILWVVIIYGGCIVFFFVITSHSEKLLVGSELVPLAGRSIKRQVNICFGRRLPSLEGSLLDVRNTRDVGIRSEARCSSYINQSAIASLKFVGLTNRFVPWPVSCLVAYQHGRHNRLGMKPYKFPTRRRADSVTCAAIAICLVRP